LHGTFPHPPGYPYKRAFYRYKARIDNILIAKYYEVMPKKQKVITVQEAGRRGGKARAERHSREQLKEWAKLGGWPKGRSRKTKPVSKKRGKQ